MQGSDLSELLLSNSCAATFKQCRRQWWLTYVRHLVTRSDRVMPVGVAELGTRVHLALEAYYGYDLDPISVLGLVYDWAGMEHPDYEDELRKERGYAITMVSGYLDWAAEEGIDVGITVIATERIIRWPIELPRSGRSVTLVGKVDQQIRRDHDGAILMRDWKTVGTLTKADSLLRDEQMRFYAMLQSLEARERGEITAGMLYTMLLRSKRTARATPPFYRQVEVSYNRHDHNSTWLRVTGTAEDILDVTDRLERGYGHHEVAYPTAGGHCAWGCPFVNICHLADDGSRFEDALAGNHVEGDPWAYYGNNLIRRVLEAFSHPAADTMDTSG